MKLPDEQELPGFHYDVSEEQIRAFSACSPAERLRWLEEMREVTWKLASPETKRSWGRLRRSA